MEILQDDKNYRDQRTIRLNTVMKKGSCAVDELYLTINDGEAILVRSNTIDSEPEIFTLTTGEVDLFIEACTQYRKEVAERNATYLEQAHKIALEHDIPLEYNKTTERWYITGKGSANTPKQLFDTINGIVEDQGRPF